MNYEWAASGTLLEKGVCIDEKYRKEFAPSQKRTKIHTTIEYHTVRNVDAKDQTLSFDLILTLKWLDPFQHMHPGSAYDFYSGYILMVAETIDNHGSGRNGQATFLYGTLTNEVVSDLRTKGRFHEVVQCT